MFATLGSAAALLLVATYYLLASVPFAYYHFLQFPHFWWMPLFLRVHPLVFAAGAAGLALGAGPPIAPLVVWRRRYAAGAGAVALCMMLMVAVPAAQSYAVAGTLCFAALSTLIAGCALGLAAGRDVLARRVAGSGRMWFALVGDAACAGLVVAAIYLGAAVLAGRADGVFRRVEMTWIAALSLGLHLALFVVASALVACARTLGARLGWTAGRTAVAVGALTAGLTAVVVRRVVLSALDLDETFAAPLALAIGVAAVAVALKASVGASGRRRDVRIAGWLVVAALAVFVLPPAVRFADWGFTLQKLLVLAAWLAVSLTTVLLSGASGPAFTRRWALAGAALATAAVTLGAAGRPAGAGSDRRPPDPGLALEQFATFDPSLRVVLDLVRPMMTDREYFAALRRTGEATAEAADPVTPLRLAQTVAPAAHRPNIFILVVDSLRPDYLSPYNPAVTFTPSIDAFARESVVMRRAFTPYAGTGLSEPAIWAGGLIPRRMYPRPFAPVNNLERLVAAGGFRSYISVDEILGLILDGAGPGVRLDSHIAHPDRKEEAFKFELCRTLNELTGRLDHDPPAEPIFFFTQSQNLHIRVIDTEGPHLWITRPDIETLFPPAASAIARLDTCFGRFIRYLKTTGRYDDSIVVLTADHGDSYGEEGRWGHAFYVAPEILRIPLIVHVPPARLSGRRLDAEGVSWLTDVTPTLYELLGVPPAGGQGVAGRPLFWQSGEQRPPRPDRQLVQSSYSRIYGLIDADARWLYTADANREREELYDLTGPGVTPQPIAQADRLRYQRWLLEALARLNAQYASGVE